MSGVLDKQMDADLARGCFKKIVNPGDALGLHVPKKSNPQERITAS